MTVLFGGYQPALSLDMESNNCRMTPPGYEAQELVAQERHLLSYVCVLDPHNG